jgi:hypothetical protein
MLFVHISREEGLSWLIADAPAPTVPATRGTPADLARAARDCTTLVSWDAGGKLLALEKRAVFAPGQLRAVELSVRAPKPAAPHDAHAVMVAFFTARPGLLALGCVPSAEQWRVVSLLQRGRNVLLRAVAGAGKSTTLKLSAGCEPTLRHLLLTYNKRLQLDVARSAPPNMTVCTYHAVAGRAYGATVRNDEQLRQFVRMVPESPLVFDRLLIDEGQDMSVELFALVRRLLAANPAAGVVIVGDELQAINNYRGAHAGFLTEAPALFAALSPRPWGSCRLGVSHRLTPATAAFVNAHLYRADVLVGGNLRDPDRRPRYIAAGGGKRGLVAALAAAVAEAVAEFGPAGVFVLAPSVRGLAGKTSPIAELVRTHLVGVPTYVGSGEDERVDDDLIRGKLAVLSFNAVKGCERPCVIIAGLDESYFRYFERAWPADSPRLPNVLTVAATRASALLVVVAAARDTLRTIDVARLGLHADVRGAAGPARRARPAARKPRTVAIAKFVMHLHPEVVRGAMALVNTRRATLDEVVREAASAAPAGDQKAPPVNLPANLQPAPPRLDSRARFGVFTEDLRFVYGALAPVLAEVARTGTTVYAQDLEAPEIVATAADIKPYGNQITAADHAAYPPEFWEVVSSACGTDCGARTPAEWAVLAVALHAFHGGRHHIARQVADYTWVDDAALTATRDIVVHALAGRAGAFGVYLEGPGGPGTICGVADFVETAGAVWEFKLGELCEEHELQLACYLALRGGGEGVLMSLLHRDDLRCVYLAPEDAGPLLAALAANGERTETRSAAELVAAFDAGEDIPLGGDFVPEFGGMSLDDVY